jgi:hypothetical protein
MALVAAQDRNGDVTVLHEATAVQPTVKSVAHASRLFRSLWLRSMPLRFT